MEQTNDTNQESKNFNFPRGNLKKEMNVPIDLSDPINCLKQEIENFNFPRDDLKNPYQVHYEVFNDIEVNQIEIFNKVKFLNTGTKPYPIVLTDGKNYQCIYRQDLIAAAFAAGDHTIRCLVKHITAELSDRVLAVKATGIRIKPEGDPIPYAEILLASKTIFEGYEDSGRNTGHVQHGGARRGEAFEILKEDDFIDAVLVDEFGKTRQTILNYLSDSKNISDDLFRYLIEENAGKIFFEKIRKNKNEALRSLEEVSEDEQIDITDYATIVVSDSIKRAFMDFKLDKPIPSFTLLTSDEMNFVENEVAIISSQIEKEIAGEFEKSEFERLKSVEDDEQDVKFPKIEKDEENASDGDKNQTLRAELKIIHEELGNLLADVALTDVKTEAMKISAKMLRLLTSG